MKRKTPLDNIKPVKKRIKPKKKNSVKKAPVKKKPTAKKKRLWLLIFPVTAAVAGGYILFTALFPAIALSTEMKPEQIERKVEEAKQQNKNLLIIPKIGVSVAYFTGDERVLEKGAWHRFPWNGDPVKGGNFILSAHRFVLDWTPERTRQQSPFYNVHRLKNGDEIVIVHDRQRYDYKISKKYKVAPTAVEIEGPSEEAKLTLYTCTFKGETDGREVFEAVKK